MKNRTKLEEDKPFTVPRPKMKSKEANFGINIKAWSILVFFVWSAILFFKG